MFSSFAGNLEYFLKSLLQQVAACGFWRDSQPAVGLAHAGVGLVLNSTRGQRLWHWGSARLTSCLTCCSCRACRHEVRVLMRDQKLQNIFRRSLLVLGVILPAGNGNRSSPVSLSSAVASTRCQGERMRLGGVRGSELGP